MTESGGAFTNRHYRTNTIEDNELLTDKLG